MENTVELHEKIIKCRYETMRIFTTVDNRILTGNKDSLELIDFNKLINLEICLPTKSQVENQKQYTLAEDKEELATVHIKLPMDGIRYAILSKPEQGIRVVLEVCNNFFFSNVMLKAVPVYVLGIEPEEDERILKEKAETELNGVISNMHLFGSTEEQLYIPIVNNQATLIGLTGHLNNIAIDGQYQAICIAQEFPSMSETSIKVSNEQQFISIYGPQYNLGIVWLDFTENQISSLNQIIKRINYCAFSVLGLILTIDHIRDIDLDLLINNEDENMEYNFKIDNKLIQLRVSNDTEEGKLVCYRLLSTDEDLTSYLVYDPKHTTYVDTILQSDGKRVIDCNKLRKSIYQLASKP